jgi:multisubunit Na+/H+ antiporter MnhB subunit
MTPQRLPGSAWLAWLRNLTLRVGVLAGVYLSTVMVAALLAANRIPFLEDVAELRNAVSYAVFALVVLVPVACFLRAPGRMFLSGVTGWLVFTLSYWFVGIWFERLHTRFHRPLHVFMLGAAFYGVLAVAAWVARMVMEARHHPITATRRRPY